MRLLFFIPSFNDQEGLVKLVNTLIDMYPTSMVLIIDDGSDPAIKLPDIGNRILLHRLLFNVGLGLATSVALDFFIQGQFDYLVRLDADGQHPVNEVMGLLRPLQSDSADVVWGERNNHILISSSEKLFGSFAKRTTSTIGRLIFDSFVDDWFTGFFAMNRIAANLAARYHLERYCEVQLLCIFHNADIRIAIHKVDQLERIYGQTSISFFTGVMIFFRSILIIGLYAIRMSPK